MRLPKGTAFLLVSSHPGSASLCCYAQDLLLTVTRTNHWRVFSRRTRAVQRGQPRCCEETPPNDIFVGDKETQWRLGLLWVRSWRAGQFRWCLHSIWPLTSTAVTSRPTLVWEGLIEDKETLTFYTHPVSSVGQLDSGAESSSFLGSLHSRLPRVSC